MHVYAITVLALVATALSAPSCSPDNACSSGSTCCLSGPPVACNGNETAYDSLFLTEFSLTHHGAHEVEDQVSLLLYRLNEEEPEEPVTCWTHEETYRVELRSERWCAMKGFMLQLHPDSRGSFPVDKTLPQGLLSIGCNAVSHRERLTQLQPLPEVNFMYRASKNKNYQQDITFRYIVVYSFWEYVQTSTSFPVCPPPYQPPPPCNNSTSTDTEDDEEMESGNDLPSNQQEDDEDIEAEAPNQPSTDWAEVLAGQVTVTASPDSTAPAEQEGGDEETASAPAEEQDEEEGGEETNMICGITRPLSNWTRLYTDNETDIQYTCNLVTPVTKIHCDESCDKEVAGQMVKLCCGVKEYRMRTKDFECVPCSSQTGNHEPIVMRFEINIPKKCRCSSQQCAESA